MCLMRCKMPSKKYPKTLEKIPNKMCERFLIRRKARP